MPFIRYNMTIMLDICIMLAGLIMHLPMFAAVSFFGGVVEILAFVNGTYYFLFRLEFKYSSLEI